LSVGSEFAHCEIPAANELRRREPVEPVDHLVSRAAMNYCPRTRKSTDAALTRLAKNPVGEGGVIMRC
jgi:hypothetical protein